MTELSEAYKHKYEAYYQNPREDLVRLVTRTGLTVLEVGCGTGATGKRLLESGKAKWVTGIELVPEQGEIARSVLNEVYIGDINEMTFDWEPEHFDCFIFGDILEHLADPWGLLRRLRPILAASGIAVASIPNVRHWPVLADLMLHDEWKYCQDGILDITHLRFFTLKSAVRLFVETGYSVQLIQPYFSGRRYSIPNRFTFGLLSGFLAQRWLMRLQPARSA